MIMAKITVDGQTYPSKKAALKEFLQAMAYTDGSERERMSFAYCAIMGGCTNINTYKEIAV